MTPKSDKIDFWHPKKWKNTIPSWFRLNSVGERRLSCLPWMLKADSVRFNFDLRSQSGPPPNGVLCASVQSGRVCSPVLAGRNRTSEGFIGDTEVSVSTLNRSCVSYENRFAIPGVELNLPTSVLHAWKATQSAFAYRIRRIFEKTCFWTLHFDDC